MPGIYAARIGFDGTVAAAPADGIYVSGTPSTGSAEFDWPAVTANVLPGF